MKTLAILAVILGILFIYFVARSETSLIVKGGDEVKPGGIDIPKLVLDKANEMNFQVLNDKSAQILGSDTISSSVPLLIDKIKNDAGDLVSKAINKVGETIKNPIEDKVNEILCPKKLIPVILNSILCRKMDIVRHHYKFKNNYPLVKLLRDFW